MKAIADIKNRQNQAPEARYEDLLVLSQTVNQLIDATSKTHQRAQEAYLEHWAKGSWVLPGIICTAGTGLMLLAKVTPMQAQTIVAGTLALSVTGMVVYNMLGDGCAWLIKRDHDKQLSTLKTLRQNTLRALSELKPQVSPVMRAKGAAINASPAFNTTSQKYGLRQAPLRRMQILRAQTPVVTQPGGEKGA